MYFPWYIWLIILILSIFLLWLFFGHGEQEFIGFDHLSRLMSFRGKPKKANTKLEHTVTIDNSIAVEREASINQSKIEVTEVKESVRDPEESLREPHRDLGDKSLTSRFNIEYENPLPTPREYKTNYNSKGEQICRETLEELFGRPFPTVRPDFLRNHTGHNMELDCYNHDLMLAVEYNGQQHYEYPNKFSNSETSFVRQTERDSLKRRLCDRHGIYLITVPYNIPYSDIPEYIKERLPPDLKTLCKES